MALSYRDTQFVKAMLSRGDRQHDIAAYFGVNGGRIAEVATGDCELAKQVLEEKIATLRGA